MALRLRPIPCQFGKYYLTHDKQLIFRLSQMASEAGYPMIVRIQFFDKASADTLIVDSTRELAIVAPNKLIPGKEYSMRLSLAMLRHLRLCYKVVIDIPY